MHKIIVQCKITNEQKGLFNKQNKKKTSGGAGLICKYSARRWKAVLWYLPTGIVQKQKRPEELGTPRFFFKDTHHTVRKIWVRLYVKNGAQVRSLPSSLLKYFLLTCQALELLFLLLPSFYPSCVSTRPALLHGLWGWSCPTTALPREVDGGRDRRRKWKKG